MIISFEQRPTDDPVTSCVADILDHHRQDYD